MAHSPIITSTINSMADVWEAYRDELEGMERQARTNLDSSVALVNTVAAHILNSGGKRIRPFFLVLSARLCGYTGHEHHQLASLVEFIHTASLLHDDVVDEADIRRGRPTARKVWGNQISILVGDYLYSKAFCQIVDFRNHGINDVLGEACKKMAEGEVLQLYYNGNPSMSEAEYLKIVEYKTAGLIAAACRMGAMLADASEAQQEALFRFGRHLGIAFQVADDTLDYTANGEHLGKSLGQDLRQGKATLPLLHLLHHCSEQDRQMIIDRMETRTLTEEDLGRFIRLMEEFGVSVPRASEGRTFAVPTRGYRAPAIYAIEPDATAASYFQALPLVVGGTLQLPGLRLPGAGLQGDSAFIEVIQRARLRPDGQTLSENFHEISDTFLTLAAIAPLLNGATHISGIAHTRKQETDRVSGMANELRRLGQDVIEVEDALTIVPRPLRSGQTVETYGDHRFAMSFGILGSRDLNADGRPWLTIADPGCCAKTFPHFFELLASLRQKSPHA